MSTIIEKIFAAHSTDRVAAGETIWLDIDVRTARDFGGPNVVK
ncbi:MAG: homoaconitate hydratase family protein, partial [Thermoplasmata archaeon]